MYSKIRIYISQWVLNNPETWQGKIGGPGQIVEIDECCLGKTKITTAKHKRQRNHIWILGGYERKSNLFFLIPILDRKATTLIPIIQEHVLPGTTIITDELKSYSHLSEIGYNHKSVNHSKYFVDPDDNTIHSNTIEGFWMHLRKYMPNIKKDSELYALYFIELAFRKRYRNNLYDMLRDVIKIQE
jgi:transposase-like protein